MIPARRAFLVLGLLTLLLALSPLSPRIVGLVGMVDGAVLLGVLVDWLLARRIPLRARRGWPETLTQLHPSSGEAERTRLTLELESEGLRRGAGVTIEIEETLHPALATLPWRRRLELDRPRRFEIALEPSRRGVHEAGPLTARVRGPLGLCWAQRRLLEPERISVYPRMRWGGRVGKLLALAQRHELGTVTLDRRGLGGEIYALRRYRAGDPRTRIHWKATARRGFLVTREDTWERGRPVVILLDCGRAMSTVEDGLTKLDHSLAASLALVRLAAGHGDQVTIVAFSDRIQRIVRVRPSTTGLALAYRQLYDLEARPVESLYDLAAETVLQMTLPRSTVMVLTSLVDLATAEILQEALNRLRRRHRPVLVNLEDASVRRLAEEPPRNTAEAYAKLASLEILLRNRDLATELRRRGIAAVAAPADRLALESLETYLEILRLGAGGRRMPARGRHGARFAV
ncbi:MAG TPA: DUF58 domain-containing protein [Thermoanaerobaculia bacterium]|nr:DUF58 domain-containing protein [Thermoanaerobaculia bacterium]